MGKAQVISIFFDDAIEIVENLEFLLHKGLPENREERISILVNSLRARIQLHKEVKKFQQWEEED